MCLDQWISNFRYGTKYCCAGGRHQFPTIQKKCVSVFHFMCSLWHIIIVRKQMPVDYFLIVFGFIYTQESEVVQLGVGLAVGLLQLKLER